MAAMLLLALPALAFVPAPPPLHAARPTRLSQPAIAGCHRRAPPMRAQLDGTGAFKDIQEYPATLDIKVIGVNEGPFVSDIVTLAAENACVPESDVQVRWRDKGKYRSVTMRIRFENADQVYAVYAAMDRDPRVKYKL